MANKKHSTLTLKGSSLVSKMESLELNYEEVKEILMCSICQDGIAKPPIHQCPNGHIMCASCIKVIKECPVCRVPLLDLKIRNVAVEQLAQNLMVECKNKKHGCTSKEKMIHYAEHLARCPYGEFNHCQMLGAKCDEMSSEREFKAHVLKKHVHTCFDSCGACGQIFQEIAKADLQRNAETIWEPVFLQTGDGQMFTMISKFEKADQTFTWRCALCPHPSMTGEIHQNYRIHMLVEKESSETKLHWTGPVISFSKLKKEFDSGAETNEESSFCVPLKTIRGFVSEKVSEVLKWTVKVSIVEADKCVPEDLFSLFVVDIVHGIDIPSVPSIYYREGPESSKKSIHQGTYCDSCEDEVKGIRYKCTECLDFDLCENCEKLGIHDQHVFFRSASRSLNPKMTTFFRKLYVVENVDGDFSSDID